MSRRRFIKVVVASMLLLIGLMGCSSDRWEEIAAGDFVVVPQEDLTGQIGKGVIQGMGVDRQNRKVVFYLVDGSEINDSFVPRD